jgi:hypothetical protein
MFLRLRLQLFKKHQQTLRISAYDIVRFAICEDDPTFRMSGVFSKMTGA